MAQQEFGSLMSDIASDLEGRAVDAELATYLNKTYPVDGKVFSELTQLCEAGEREGWLMQHEGGGIKFGRAIKPGGKAGAFSVDVVRMKNVKGPHHIHTTGEIGAIMPVEGAPQFDGIEPGWYVYPPGSDHYPTVSGGGAYVLYLLPDGAIEFTGK
ncbi:DUF4863 family protein [Sulfitobacter sp. JB4-11]|uniref:4-hydroxylaminobenzoate lyase n=1 Tax=Sulfitobacter rhodophyticola TaxID=3238304 RepID=UPI003511505F